MPSFLGLHLPQEVAPLHLLQAAHRVPTVRHLGLVRIMLQGLDNPLRPLLPLPPHQAQPTTSTVRIPSK